MTAASDFASILFADPADRDSVDDRGEPDFFADLNLDQVVRAVIRGRDDYQLAPFFYTPLRQADTIAYRHEMFQELQNPGVRQAVDEFAKRMRAVRQYLEQVKRLYYARQKQLWFLDAAYLYAEAATGLHDALQKASLTSRGMQGLQRFLQTYVSSALFAERAAEARRLREQLAAVRYTVDIRGDRIRVGRYDDEPDYSSEVADTFARFRQGDVKDYNTDVRELAEISHLEAVVLQYVADLNRDLFDAVAAFASRNGGFLDPVVVGVDREVRFYLAWIDHIGQLAESGLAFCLPEISTSDKQSRVSAAFDVALADKLVNDSREVVTNDVDLHGDERILVISGPNQGGKTTYARMFGQLHHLARLGCPVPGRKARLFLTDGVFTHFEREEGAADLHGKLEDDLLRVHRILEHATARSVVIMNEIFTSTTLEDAMFLGEQIMRRLIDLDCIAVYVTFVDELSRLGSATVSLVSTVEDGDSSQRTFKVVRRPADGLSYALSIAGKYRLTYEALKERIS